MCKCTIININHVLLAALLCRLMRIENNLCFRYASHLLDDILRTRSNILSLKQLNNLPQLVTQMNDHQLANFCRVLYFVLTDAEACEDRNTCKLFHFYLFGLCTFLDNSAKGKMLNVN
jgi:hypothetical protein